MIIGLEITKQKGRKMKTKFSYTKQVKEHICQMAVRKKYKEKFDLEMALLESALTKRAIKNSMHSDAVKNVPETLLSFLSSSKSAADYCGRVLFDVSQYIALQSCSKVRSVKLSHVVYATSKDATILGCNELKAIKSLIKEIDQFASDVGVSLNSYKTYLKAVEALSWIESLHPEYAQSPACNIIPIDTINRVNEMMKVIK